MMGKTVIFGLKVGLPFLMKAAKEEMGMKINQTASEVIEELGGDLSAGLSSRKFSSALSAMVITNCRKFKRIRC
ncbi:MAG: hypothetical protein ACLSA6_04545 [Holdemania massiliensis]